MSVSVGHSSAILPDDGIASGTNWEDVPDDWVCPECAMGKDDFDMVEI
jgi:rubredoxin